MAYGIQITGILGDLQLDSEKELVNQTPVESGTATAPTTSWNQYNDLLFINATVASGSYRCVFMNGTGFHGHTNTPSYSDQTSAVSIPYIVLKNANTITPSANYGVQIYNSNLEVEFDSRNCAGAGNILVSSFVPSQSKSGNPNTSSTITSDLSTWVAIKPTDSLTLIGYMFSNNHSTYGTGIYYVGYRYSIWGTGIGYEANYYTLITGEKV